MRIFPAPLLLSPAFSFSFSMKGVRYATAFFITRALFTTCGRNIFPAPKRSPTCRIPPIKGPSITCKGRPYFWRASSVSTSMKSVIPLSRAWSNLSSTEPFLHSSSLTTVFPPALTVSANSNKRSVASGRRFSRTSSTLSLRSAGISSYTANCPAFTIAISNPA